MITLIIDGAWGSSGKGLLAQRLVRDQALISTPTSWGDYAVAAISSRPNAGHTFIRENGEKDVFHQLPVAAIDPCVDQILLGSASVIRVPILAEELKRIPRPERVMIDWRAAVINDAAIEEEKKSLTRIASTLQGCGAALARKVMREPGAIAASLPAHAFAPAKVGDTVKAMQESLKVDDRVLLESTQGFELSLNAARFYPFCTSHDVTPAGILASWAVPWSAVSEIWGAIRTYPIRVGNIEGGESGPVYSDQKELTWNEVAERAGYSGPIEGFRELTSTTHRIRRIFEFSAEQFQNFMTSCRPSSLFISHMDHLDHELYCADRLDEILSSAAARTFLFNLLYLSRGCPLTWLMLGTGPRRENCVYTSPSVLRGFLGDL